MQTSLIITTYNRPKALSLVLRSVELQRKAPFEIIIADDGSDEKTNKVISNFKSSSGLNIIHSFQSDKGFRVARSRNKAIAKANCEYIVLIDGDMILHRNFIYDHEKNAKFGYFIQGTRVLIGQSKVNEIFETNFLDVNFFTNGLMNRKNAIHSNLLSFIFSKNKNFLTGIKTCNVAFYKDDCLSVNGFNNKFEGWGNEDSEFFARLMNKGIIRKTLRFNAIQFHLWHNEESKASLLENEILFNKTINERLQWCEKGIDEFL
jgi:glycosyltransferase involved in cell wall biosynthesis